MDNIPIEVFRARLVGRGRILLPAWSLVPCIELLQCDHMVCTQERCYSQSRKYYPTPLRLTADRYSLEYLPDLACFL